MCLVWKYGEYNKSYEHGSKKCPLEVLSIFTFGIVRWRVGKIAANFCPKLLKNRFLQPVYLLRIVTQLVEMLACFLPCSGVTDKWHLSRSFYAGLLKWRENKGAKMTSWSRKKFPVRVSETNLAKITLPCFNGVGLWIKRSSVRIRPWPLRWVLGQSSLLPLSQGEAFTLASISYLAILVKYILAKKKKELDCCRFEPKRRFWSAFQFPGTHNKWMYYSTRTVCELNLNTINASASGLWQIKTAHKNLDCA